MTVSGPGPGLQCQYRPHDRSLVCRCGQDGHLVIRHDLRLDIYSKQVKDFGEFLKETYNQQFNWESIRILIRQVLIHFAGWTGRSRKLSEPCFEARPDKPQCIASAAINQEMQQNYDQFHFLWNWFLKKSSLQNLIRACSKCWVEEPVYWRKTPTLSE